MPLSEQDLLEKAENLKTLLVQRATEGGGEDTDYQALRRALMSDMRLKNNLPQFLKGCRTLSEFWGFIRGMGSTWADRREVLRVEFDPLLTALEKGLGSPADDIISAGLLTVDAEHVRTSWSKALDRRATDPEGAITIARTLVEHVCKYILDESNTPYTDKDDLPRLYHKAAEQISLAPNQHTEESFKKILGACQAIVNGLAELRNSLSDAHGKGRPAAKPAPRHAELAVNLAGTMATYLIATWDWQNSK